MNNKPVAWIGETLMGRQYINGQNGILPVGTPLYTHPAKTLTDEEILTIFNDCKFHVNEETEKFNIYNFARAILRKAQEK